MATVSRRRVPGWARDLLLFALLFFGVRAYQSRDALRGPAPALAMQALDGRTLAVSDYRGAPVLVHFWATWCGVCTAEESNIRALSADLPVVSVASRSGDAAALGRHVSEAGITYPVVPDPDGGLAQRFGVRAFPTSFVLDADGQVRHVEVGYTTEIGLRLRMWLAGR